MQYRAYSGTVLHYVLAKMSLNFSCVVLETALSSLAHALNFFREFFHHGLLRIFPDIRGKYEQLTAPQGCSVVGTAFPHFFWNSNLFEL